MGLRPLLFLNTFSAETDLRRQNMTSINVVRLWTKLLNHYMNVGLLKKMNLTINLIIFQDNLRTWALLEYNQ